MKKNLTNRYIDDTTARIENILRRTASYKDYVTLYDNMYGNVRLSALYNSESTYLMHDFTCLWIIQGQAMLTINGKEQMLISTTPNVEGRKIKEYRGVVFGEVINGIDFTKDFMMDCISIATIKKPTTAPCSQVMHSAN